MRDEIDLEAAAELVAEMLEQEGVSVDRGALYDLLEESGPEGSEEILGATDPGGLLDTLGEMDADVLEW